MQRLIDVWVGVKRSVTDDATAVTSISMSAFELQEDILNIHCDTNQSKRLS